MIIIYAILFASAGLSTLAEASAIKGHAQPTRALLEEGRSIKLAASEKMGKSASPVAPVLESSKKIYNDESIRRLAAQPQSAPASPLAAEPVAIKAEPVVPAAAPSVAVVPPSKFVAQQQEPVVVQKIAEPAAAAAVVQQAPVVVAVEKQQPEQQSSVVVKEAPVVVAAVEAKSAPVVEQQAAPKADQKIVQKEAPVEPKSAPIEPAVKLVEPVQAAPVVSKPVDELPAQSERSAQPSVVVVEQQAAAPVQPEKAQIQAAAAPESIVKESPLEAKKEEVVAAPVAAPAPVPVPAVEPLHIEVPAPDPGLVLSEPIDSTTKLLIDLDEHVQKFLPADEQPVAQPAKDQVLVPGVDFSPASPPVSEQTSGKSAPLVPYSGLDEPIVPPLPSLDGVEKASAASSSSGGAAAAAAAAAAASSSSSPSATRQGNNSPQNQQQVITQLLDQLDSLQNRIQDTINQLVARRRYVMSALLRPMGTYVRRVRTNLERLQTRVNQLQAAAVSVGGGNGPSRPGGFVDAAAIETIRRRIDDISKRISDIVNRIRFSLTPTSAPLNSNGRK